MPHLLEFAACAEQDGVIPLLAPHGDDAQVGVPSPTRVYTITRGTTLRRCPGLVLHRRLPFATTPGDPASGALWQVVARNPPAPAGFPRKR